MDAKLYSPRLWLAMAALGIGSAAEAADPFAFNLICDDSGGAGTYTVNPIKLRERLLDEAAVSLTALNLDNAGGVTSSEMFSALVYERFCEVGAVRENGVARPTACPEGQANKLMNARNLLSAFSAHPHIRFVRMAEAPATDPLLQPGLDAQPAWPLLDERRRFVRMECLRSDTAAAGGGNSGGGRNNAPDDGRGLVRIAKNPEDLTIPAVQGSLKNVPQAELSYVDDNVANTETFRVHATIGLNIPVGANHRLLPFVQFIRSHVEDTTGANAPQETAKLSVGVLSSWRPGGGLDLVEIAPLYVNDLEDGAEFVSVRVGWRPGFLYRLPSFDTGWFFLCAREEVNPTNGRCSLDGQYFAVRTDARLIATAGRVLDVGQNPALVANRNYARIGGEARVTLFGRRGIVRDFSADVSYRHLFSLDGAPDNLSAFNAGVNYWIAGSQHASIRYAYERRTDEDTLKRTDQWTIGLGLRF